MASINATTSSGIVATADNTGQLQLQSAGTTIATVSSTGLAVTGTIASSTGTTYPIVSGTSQASTSGTSIDFTGIPSWVKRITVMFNGVSLSGTSRVQIQLGSGSFQTSGYVGQSANIGGTISTFSAGFVINENIGAAEARYGSIYLNNISSNIWVESGVTAIASTSTPTMSAGSVSLSGVLDRVRITTVNGTDTFDAGSINILYE